MKERNAWWLTLIAVGMTAYGAAAVWITIAGRWRAYGASSFVILALIAVVGVVCFVRDIARQPGDRGPRALAPSIEPYVLAWRRLWGTKWLLGVYGCVAAIGVVGSLITEISWHFTYTRMMGTTYSAFITSVEQFEQIVWQSLPQWVRFDFDKFVPRVGITSATMIMPVVVLLVLFWVVPALSRISREPGHAGSPGLVGACLVVLLCVSTVADVVAVRQIRGEWAGTPRQTVMHRVAPSSTHAVAPVHGQPIRASVHESPPLYLNLLTVLMCTIVNAAFMGAVLGSLARLRNGPGDIKATFLADAVRFFAPLAGVYLVFYLLLLVLYIPWRPVGFFLPTPLLVLMLMYAPMGIVTQDMGFCAAVKHSLRVWKETAWRTISLIATGAFLSTLVTGPLLAVELIFPKASWAQVAIRQAHLLVGIAISALVFLAVWEFYSTHVLERQESLQQSA